jgi:alpha-ketoglutarate-dependent taurine dioxygenase
MIPGLSHESVLAIKEHIAASGACIVHGIETEDQLSHFVSQFGAPVDHRDSGDHAVTRVEHNANVSSKLGYAGFSTNALELHTDRSTIENPPNLMFLFCNKQATGSGGQSRALDGLLLYDYLRTHHADLLNALLADRAAYFSDGTNSYHGPIFERLENGRMRIRFRVDENGYFRYDVHPHLVTLLRIMRNIEFTFSLEQGDALILDNSRWLHGRTAFEGTRSILRLLAQSDDWLSAGFDASEKAASAA